MTHILFFIEVKILVLIEWYRSPQLCWRLTLEWLSYLSTYTPITYKHMQFSWLFLDPHLSTYHSNIGVWLRKVTELDTSSLGGRRADAAAHCFQLFQRTIRDQNESTST